ncbi:MAG: hypothetical protein Q7K45_03660, partial [Nanoarchaeota archaeon]|nr:hypothetical protein [Nanoarchaeota archaeon]
LLLEETHPDLAVVVYGGALILIDITIVKKFLSKSTREYLLAMKPSKNVEEVPVPFRRKLYLKKIDENTQQITAYQPSSGGGGLFNVGGGPEKLTLNQDFLFKNAVIGFCEFKDYFRGRDFFCSSLVIFRIAARKKWGILLFELACSYAASNHKAVVIDRGEVSLSARKMLEYFDLKRRDVQKYPAALATYPELIGYTKEEVVNKFGTGGIFYSSTFNRDGFPDGTPEEKQKQLRKIVTDMKPRYDWKSNNYSYVSREGDPKHRLVMGGLASLDKAYYYDGKKGLLQLLMNRWNTAGELSGIQGFGYTAGKFAEEIYVAGYAFFQSFVQK